MSELEILRRSIKENESWISAVERHQSKILKELEKQRAHIKTIKNYVAEQDGFVFEYQPHNKKFARNKYSHPNLKKNNYINPMFPDVYGKDIARHGNVHNVYNNYGPTNDVKRWQEYYHRVSNTMNLRSSLPMDFDKDKTEVIKRDHNMQYVPGAFKSVMQT